MRVYIFTSHEIQTIKRFHMDGRKTQAIRTLKHRCEERKANLEEHIQILDDFLSDYANPEPECFGTEKVNEVDLGGLNLDCLKCAAQGRCLTAYVEAQRSAPTANLEENQ